MSTHGLVPLTQASVPFRSTVIHKKIPLGFFYLVANFAIEFFLLGDTFFKNKFCKNTRQTLVTSIKNGLISFPTKLIPNCIVSIYKVVLKQG